MQTLRPKRSSLWRGAILPCIFSGLIAGAALASPAALAGAKRHAHSDGALPPGGKSWGKPHVPRSGPHPSDTNGKPTPTAKAQKPQ
jgi:hypothetical protein